MIAYLNLRYTVPERRAAFEAGLRRLGYEIRQGFTQYPEPDDLLVTWNRIGSADYAAKRFSKVIVAENAAWGNDYLGRQWYSLARNYHNTAGCVPYGGPERWDRLGQSPQPFRTSGETVILPQRGIGSPPTVMPPGWARDAWAKYGGRIRQHPGRNSAKPLNLDLLDAGRVVTWGSGAAIKALLWGIPVVSEMPNWIGEQDNTEPGRLEMLRRLAWAQWELSEVESGEAFACVLRA